LASELELKAVVPDPAAFRAALRAGGAHPAFVGMLRDRRLDRAGGLSAADCVLRVREWAPVDGQPHAVIGYKGPTSVTPAGYKHRDEFEVAAADTGAALALFGALGYTVVQAIDRYVEVYRLEGAVARLEWYPRLDVLVEIEGAPDAIERLIRLTGLPRAACLPDPLVAFVARYEARTGLTAVLAEADLRGALPSWSAA
jgi:adenylate cyclase class IV